MVLRQLNTKDAPFMLEWMHDNSVVQDLQTDFASKTIEDCLEFIKASKDESENLHLAIVDNNDEYLGTVSLKNIAVSFAEFAITVRSSAMGKGIAKDAMEKIIDIGFEEKDLEGIYWCVAPSNKRAIRFYDKNGYHRVPSETLNIRGGTANYRFANTIGISLQERKGGTESPDSKLDQKKQYGYSFPSFCGLKR